jgi:hypothetical protein
VYANIGVSAADDKPYTADDPKWTGPWAGRTGNEGRVGPPAKIFRVLREPPPLPELPPMPERVFATRADQNGASFYTFRWKPIQDTTTHVFRAFDDGVFTVDWSQRPRPALDASQVEFFPGETIDSRWNAAKRQQVATEINQLNIFTHEAVGMAAAFLYYHTLSADALRVLASLPGNDAAFTQLTTSPLVPDDPNNANRRGPDDPDNFQIGDPANPLQSPLLRAFVDRLDGLVTNRYFYRAAHVDAAHNRSALSLATPPVILPKAVSPRSPSITQAVGGDRRLTLFWTKSRELDVVRYQIYRTDDEDRARDVRLMSLVHTENVSGETRAAELSWVDSPVDANRLLYYRLVAEDSSGNSSKPSSPVVTRAFDTSRPVPPAAEATWDAASQTVKLTWSIAGLQPDLEVALQRAEAGDDFWSRIRGWTSAMAGQVDDLKPLRGFTYQYKLRVRNRAGRTSDNEPLIGPISIPET